MGLSALLSLPLTFPSCAIRLALSEIRRGARDGQQLNLSPFCRKGPGCCCKSSAEPEPGALCLCGVGECHSMRSSTEMCCCAQAALSGTAAELSSGWGILGRFGWVEGSEGAPAGLGWCKNPAARSSYYKAEGRTGQEAKGLNGGGEIQVRCEENLFKDS